MTISLRLFTLAISAALLLTTSLAHAFCGFYVGGPGSKLTSRATQVVLMREGLRTVLSMANDYDGPLEGFAMVVPVPVVLQKEQVKTLSAELFDRIDQLDAPRLVEYWEQDPCRKDSGYGYEFSDDPLSAGGFGPNDATIRVRPGPVSVKILERFAVGEYQILILSAQDSLGLDTWLRDNGYAIPAGAEPVLRPYVQAGMKFFVAKVDPRKVHFVRGRATLSPLRFHYDTDTFALPIRLGLLSSSGTQDLVVHVLARGQRYEAANYDNAVIPTNLDVLPSAKGAFGTFYAALFDRALAAHPGAMITEYAWDAATCDPCPTPPLDEGDLAALGEEVFPKTASPSGGRGFVLSRLHTRYRKDNAGADIVFRAAPPISGGRELRDEQGALEQGARSDGVNNFQARYALRHPWAGPMPCAEPRRGVWGANPRGESAAPMAAQDLAFAPRGSVDIFVFLGQAPPDYAGFTPGSPAIGFLPEGAMGQPAPPHGGCAGCAVGARPEGRHALGCALVLGIVVLARRRRWRERTGATPRRARTSTPLLLPLLIPWLTGCSRAIELRAETASAASGSSFWVAGTEGFAAHATGDGTLRRVDYPRRRGAPDYAYEPFSLPAAHPLVIGGQTFLFTRAGDVLLHRGEAPGEAWSRVQVKLPTNGGDAAQIDAAMASPDGQIVLHLHSDTLVWATPSELVRGVFRADKTPGYVTWLGFLDGALHAVGWAEGGNQRAVFRRGGEGKWEMLGQIPKEAYLSDDLDALVRMPGGRLAVTTGAGLYARGARGGEGFAELITPEQIASKALVIAGGEETASAAAAREEGAQKNDAPKNDAPRNDAPGNDAPMERPKAAIAGEAAIAPPRATVAKGAYLVRVLSPVGHAPLLIVGGQTIGVIALGPHEGRFFACPEALSLTAAVALPEGVRLVGSDGSLLDLVGDRCALRAAGILGGAGAPGSPPASP